MYKPTYHPTSNCRGIPLTGKGKISSKKVAPKKIPGQKQKEPSSTPSPLNAIKRPPLSQYDTTLYDWEEEDSELLLQLGPQQLLISY